MATFMKLLVINIVANNFLGSCNKASTFSFALFVSFLILSISEGLSEKKAVSEPDINPETINNIMRVRNVNISTIGKLVNKSIIKTNKGSGRISGSLLSKISALVQIFLQK